MHGHQLEDRAIAEPEHAGAPQEPERADSDAWPEGEQYREASDEYEYCVQDARPAPSVGEHPTKWARQGSQDDKTGCARRGVGRLESVGAH